LSGLGISQIDRGIAHLGLTQGERNGLLGGGAFLFP
jgi:hypothetical protein